MDAEQRRVVEAEMKTCANSHCRHHNDSDSGCKIYSEASMRIFCDGCIVEGCAGEKTTSHPWMEYDAFAGLMSIDCPRRRPGAFSGFTQEAYPLLYPD